MRKTGIIFVILILWSMSGQSQSLYVPQASPKAAIEQTIGVCNIRIEYSRPSVKDRQIFGSLVPYDKVWRAGANAATTFDIDQDIIISGRLLQAGKYGLFMIPRKDQWTIILNKKWDQWGAYNYDSGLDVLRFEIESQKSPFSELCTYTFEKVTKTSGVLKLKWSMVSISIPIQTKTKVQTLSEIERTTNVLKQGWYTFSAAAQYHYYELGQNEKALAYLDVAIALEAPNPSPWMLKSQILAKQGKYEEAINMAQLAISICKKTNHEFEISENEENIRQWNQRL